MIIDVNELKALVVKKGKTMRGLAEYLGISIPTLYKKLNGPSDFYRHEMIKVAEYLEEDDLNYIFFKKKVT